MFKLKSSTTELTCTSTVTLIAPSDGRTRAPILARFQSLTEVDPLPTQVPLITIDTCAVEAAIIVETGGSVLTR